MSVTFMAFVVLTFFVFTLFVLAFMLAFRVLFHQFVVCVLHHKINSI